MYRLAMEKLKSWKDNIDKKPLIIKGARQVGKTWLMKEFGNSFFKQMVYINFENNERMKSLFSNDLDVSRLIMGLEIYAGNKFEPKETLIIFDEIQEEPMALTSLKYFSENAPEYQIIAAGSLLGVALHNGTSFPVGKVEFLDLHPLNFTEFLLAMEKEQFVMALKDKAFDIVSSFKADYINMIKQYYYIGGMPEVVLNFKNNKNFNKVREIQRRILEAYEQDFSKYAPLEVVPRIRMLWNSIPSQLSKENKKFIYGLVKEGARAKEYEVAMLWLLDCGLIHKIHRVNAPNLPLKAYEDLKAFKLFILDVGLLSCMVRLNQDILIDGSEIFKEFKGALTEQYVLQQLKTIENYESYYWTNDKGTAEIDFVVDTYKEVLPIEVKAEINLQAKSLKTYHAKYKPKISVRTSMADYKFDDWILNLPLYAINELENMLKETI